MNNIQSPRTDDAGIEQEIQAKGLTAPRVTPADIETNIVSEHYFTALQGARMDALDNVADGVIYRDVAPLRSELGLLTFCVLVLRNGFTVTGESACASPENFDAELGRKIARQNAVAKIWPLMGYALRSKLSRQPVSDNDYRMQLKDIPITVIADFVDDNDAVKALLESVSK